MSEREQLEQAIAHMEAQRAILGDAVVEAALAPLRKELAALEAPTAPEQRKQVTILFADVSGFTAMSETMDAEDVRDTMNDLWERLDGAITAQGGMIDKHIGDCVMALFGAPTAHEDDPERAIQAALAMQEALATFRGERQAELAMRIGINTGPVLLGGVGTTDEYTAMGDAVNLASRLEHAAPVGGILISHDTYRHVRGVFGVQSQAPLQVKGKVEPVQTYVVQKARPRAFRVTTRGVEGIETRMIGRDIELRQLQEALYAVVEDKEAQVITVVGEAGVGKSRLLYEFRNWLSLQSEDVRIFRGRATQDMSNLPYSLIRDLFAFRFDIRGNDPVTVARRKLEQGILTLLGAQNAESVEKAHFIGQLIGFDFSESPHLRGTVGDPQQVHDRAFHYTVQLFRTMMEDLPTAIYLDDIHWADDGSLDLIEHLVRECHNTSLLIVALARPALLERRPLWGKGQAGHTRLELRPLSRRNSRRLVREILQKVKEIPPDLRELIVRGAEGNPFYVEELIKTLVEDGVIAKSADQWEVKVKRLTEIRVPPTLTGVLQARLDRLPTIERETLQRASVVGRIFWDDIVERISKSVGQGSSELVEEREEGEEEREARKRGRLTELRRMLSKRLDADELRTLCFDLGVDYDDLPGEGQGNKARELIAYIERRERIPELVRTGQQLRPDIAWSDVLGVPSTALSALENAMLSALQAMQEKELVFERGGSAFVGTQEYIFKHAILRDVTYESVLKRLRRTYHALVAEWLIEQSGERVGEHAGLIGEHYKRAGERVQAAEWYGQAGRQAQRTYTLETAARYYQEALAVEERWEWRKWQVEVLHILGRRDAERAGLEVLEAASELPGYEEAEVSYLWGQYYEAIGEYSQAQAAVERALEANRKRDDLVGEVRCLDRLGFITWRQGQYEKAKVWYHQALNLLQDKGAHSDEAAQALAQVLNGLGTVHRQQGQFDETGTYYEQALALNRTSGNRIGEARTLSNLGATAFYRRSFTKALVYHQQALEIWRGIGDLAGEGTSLYNLAGIVLEVGDYGRAQEYLLAALSIQRATGNRWEEVNVLNVLGVLYQEVGNLSTAQKHLEQGLQLAREIGDEAGQTYLLSNLGQVARDQGDLVTAERLLKDGLSIWQKENNKYEVSYFLSYLGTVSLLVGRFEQAIEYATRALTLRQELDMRLNTTDDLATLAAVHLAMGDIEQALNRAEQALTILEDCGGVGPESPQRDYFICYQVFSAARQEEDARAALQSAYDLIIARADKITDPSLCQSFLERVPINREIVQEYENVMREA